MEKILLIAGCSHAAGSEIDGNEDSDYNRQNCYGAKLAYQMGYRPLNIAQNGATNSTIARSVLKWFESEYDPDTMDLFVLVAWSDAVRIEVPVNIKNDNKENWLDLCNRHSNWLDVSARNFVRVTVGFEGATKQQKEFNKYYQKFVAENEIMMELISINLILQIQYFLKSMNTPYLMCNSQKPFLTHTKHNALYLSLVDRDRYYNLDSPEESFYWRYKNMGYVNELAKYWHHGEEPHMLYA